jgi:phototropin
MSLLMLPILFLEENTECILPQQTHEYSSAVKQFASALASMSDTHTSINATSPIHLPPSLSKSLNSDVKRITVSLIPGLDSLFFDSRLYVEQRIARDVYPGFIKRQLALCTSMSLSVDHSIPGTPRMEYPGLGTSFCLTDPYLEDNPIVYASDGFFSVTGYSREEIILNNCRMLQGLGTNRDATRRLREAVARKEEAVELVLNYKKNGQPFWNLLYTCPILDSAGKLKFYLGGQINVSDVITSYKDLLKVLEYGTSYDDALDKERDTESEREREKDEISSDRDDRSNHKIGSRRPERSNSVKGREGRNRPSRKSFFRQFRKQPQVGSSSPGSRKSLDVPGSSPVISSSPKGEQSLKTRSEIHRLSVATQNDAYYTAYRQYVILEHSVGTSGSSLNVAICSQAALDVLGLGMAADAIAGRDIFTVLAEQAGSPSVTKAFKTTVREQVLSEGKSITLGLTLNRNNSRKSSIIGLGSLSKDDAAARDRDKKRAKGVGVGSSNNSSSTDRVVSYWTPLKDKSSRTGWVMLAVSPAAMW